MTPPAPKINVVDDPVMLFQVAAEAFLRASIEATSAGQRFAVALAGGSTPRGLYTLLATGAQFRTAVPWDQCEVFWGDERHVRPDHADSNYRMAREAMLSRVPVPEAQIHRIAGELADPDAAATEYEGVVRQVLAGRGEVPAFDLILLGLGADGHTASLFPGTTALTERQRLVVSTRVDKLGASRITMTLPLIYASRQVLFLAAGADKAPAVRDVLVAGPQGPDLPARLVSPPDGRVRWVIDQAAAQLI